MMEDTQPIKRTKELIPLSREHHDGLLFAWKLRQGVKLNVSVERLKRFSIWFWHQHIKPHFYQEEKIVSPYLPLDNELIARMKREHEYIRELILGLDKEAEPATFIQLADVLDTHIRFEERILFTFLEEQLSPGQLTTIHEQLVEHPVCDKNWDDEFWVKK
jgi:hemerythrin-like domain-containing protein